MAERRKPWYQREPYPAVVGVLLDHELLAEGGTRALQLASRIVAQESDPGFSRDRVRAVVDQLAGEHLVDTLSVADESSQAWQAAHDIVDVLDEWRAP